METAGGGAGLTSTVRKPSAPPKRFVRNLIPNSILENVNLNSAISLLPSNYNFEIHKSVHRALTISARRVALQFPDGLLLYSLPIADILRSFASVPDVLVLADPTYGACCVDDIAAHALQADLLIHYGHSCLVPVSESRLPVLYVFVDVKIDVPRLLSTIRKNFEKKSKLAVAGTIQFNSAVHAAKLELKSEEYDIVVPQTKPLSAGEVLGCTSPKVGKEIESIVFVADGRFHLEAFMIANPKVKAFRYDPYTKVLSLEEYDHIGMKEVRRDAIFRARGVKKWGIVLGTLGRQGSVKVLDRIVDKMETRGLEYTIVLMSELSPPRIALFGDSVDAWVQIACPRLSIDWGEAFKKPLLTTFELEVAFGIFPGWWERTKTVPVLPSSTTNSLNCTYLKCEKNDSCECTSTNIVEDEERDYPMDYYAQDGGEWNGSYARKTSRFQKEFK
ncbi:Diphthamide biosynthesis protein [Zostera marina]|uniref:2-(3-amino-3-carboxypropyl)histidine synthase subunit 1 n=1 Tax=Zostera marina TaxID=29655 RepID=A0A0K9PII5_ZOSMR|nr:Diphthamide biosynthesis protein [Zostera marina]